MDWQEEINKYFGDVLISKKMRRIILNIRPIY